MRFGGAVRVAVAITACWFAVRVLGAPWAGGFPASFPDSASYRDAAVAGPASTSLWWGDRPPGYPLFVWLLGRDTTRIAAVQLAVHVAAATWIGVVAVRMLRRRWIAALLAVVLTGVVVAADQALWIPLLLTESLSFSIGLAAVAAWLDAVDRGGSSRVAVAAALTIGWVSLRDASAAATTVVVVVALVWVGVAASVAPRRPRHVDRRAVVVGLAAIAVVCLPLVVAAGATGRGEASFHNDVGLRWLPDDDLRQFMVDRGMPLDDALEARSGGDAWADGAAFLTDPELAEYRRWARDHGRRALLESLVLRADWWIARAADDFPLVLDSDFRGYDVFDVRSRVPDQPLGPLDPTASLVALGVVALGALASLVPLVTRRRRLAVALALPLATTWLLVVISYVADAVEIGRHVIGPLASATVVGVVTIAFGVDELLERRARARRDERIDGHVRGEVTDGQRTDGQRTDDQRTDDERTDEQGDDGHVGDAAAAGPSGSAT